MYCLEHGIASPHVLSTSKGCNGQYYETSTTESTSNSLVTHKVSLSSPRSEEGTSRLTFPEVMACARIHLSGISHIQSAGKYFLAETLIKLVLSLQEVGRTEVRGVLSISFTQM